MGKRITPHQKELLKERIKQMAMKGFKIIDMAYELKLNRMTVSNYLKEAVKEHIEKHKENPKKIYSTVLTVYETHMNELFIGLDRAPSHTIRVWHYEKIEDLLERYVNMLTRFGIIIDHSVKIEPKEAPQVSVDVSPEMKKMVEEIKALTPEQLRELRSRAK